MKSKTAFCSTLLFLSLLSVDAFPQIKAKPLFKFNKVMLGKEDLKNDSVFVEFPYNNSSSDTYEVKKICTSCGCTTVNNMPKRISPGDSGKVRIGIALGEIDRKFPFKKSVMMKFENKGSIVLIVKSK